jgi:hypothetical protein
MANAYQEGMFARKAELGSHENPYIGVEASFIDWVFHPMIFSSASNPITRKIDWDKGWHAENDWQKRYEP